MVKKKIIILTTLPLFLLTITPLNIPTSLSELERLINQIIIITFNFLKEFWHWFISFLNNLLSLLKSFIETYLKPQLQKIWSFLKNLLWENRKQTISQEIQKEKQSFFEEIKNYLSSFFEFIKKKIEK